MDAQQTGIEPDRRTRMRGQGENPGIDDLRSGILRTENRIVEDIEDLKEMFKPERVVNQVMAVFKEEMSLRFKAVEGRNLQALGERVISEVKGRPYLFGMLGFGIAGLVFYGLMPENKSGPIEESLETTAFHRTVPETEIDYPQTVISEQ